MILAQEHVEILKTIEELINQWKKGIVSETSAIDDIYDAMESLSKWEEAESRRRMYEEMKRNSIIIQSKVRYGGKLPLSPINFEE
jgi:isocitrate dehydrogenase